MAGWLKYAISLLISLFLFWVLLGGFRGGLSGAVSTDPIPWPLFILKGRVHELLAQADRAITTGPDALLRLSRAYQDSRALYAFAKLGLAERFLDNTDKTVAQIIAEAELEPVGAARLLERAVALGLLTLIQAPSPASRAHRHRSSAWDALEFFRSATTQQQQPPAHQHASENANAAASEAGPSLSSEDSFAESVCALSSQGALLTRAHARSVREAVLFEGETLYERWNGLLDRLQPLHYKSKEDSSSAFRGGIVVPPSAQHQQQPPGQPTMHNPNFASFQEHVPFDPLARPLPKPEKEAPIAHKPRLLLFRYAESVVASSLASAVFEDFDFAPARTTVELLGSSLSRHLVQSLPALRATVILDRDMANLLAPGLSSNRFQVNIADAPLHEPGSGSHVRHAYFPANADLYLLVGAVNEWNYDGDDKTVALLRNIHTRMSDDSRLLLVDTFAPSVRASAMTPPRQLLSQKEMNRYVMTQLRNSNWAGFQGATGQTDSPQPLSAASPFASGTQSAEPATTTAAAAVSPVISLASLKSKSHVLSLVARAGLELNRSVALRSGLFSLLVLQRKQTPRLPDPAPEPEPPKPERSATLPEEEAKERANERVEEEEKFVVPDHQTQEQQPQPLSNEPDARNGNSFELRSEEQQGQHDNQNQHDRDLFPQHPPSHSDPGLTQDDHSAHVPQGEPHAHDDERAKHAREEEELTDQPPPPHSHENLRAAVDEEHGLGGATEPLGLGHISDMPDSEKDLLSVLGSLGSQQHQQQQPHHNHEQQPVHHFDLPDQPSPSESAGECLAGDPSCPSAPTAIRHDEENAPHRHAQKRVDQEEQQDAGLGAVSAHVPATDGDDSRAFPPGPDASSPVAPTSPLEDLSGRSPQEEESATRQPVPVPPQPVEIQREEPASQNSFFSSFFGSPPAQPPEPQQEVPPPPLPEPAVRQEQEQEQYHDQRIDPPQQHHDFQEQYDNQQQRDPFPHVQQQQQQDQQHAYPVGEDRYEPPEAEPEYPPHVYAEDAAQQQQQQQQQADSTAAANRQFRGEHWNADDSNQHGQESEQQQPFFPAPQFHDNFQEVQAEPAN